MIKDLLQYVEPKMLLLMALGIVGLTCTGAYLYLLKEPSASYFEWQSKLKSLQNERDTGLTLANDIRNLRNELEKLHSESDPASSDQSLGKKIATVIGQLDEAAENHSVALLGVSPGMYTPVYMFEEMPFIVEVMGSYNGLFSWLYEVENQIGSLVVKRFAIEPIGKRSERLMRLTMVSYHLREKAQ